MTARFHELHAIVRLDVEAGALQSLPAGVCTCLWVWVCVCTLRSEAKYTGARARLYLKCVRGCRCVSVHICVIVKENLKVKIVVSKVTAAFFFLAWVGAFLITSVLLSTSLSSHV